MPSTLPKILISHKGNLHGPEPDKENHPDHITRVLAMGYDCEIDVWNIAGHWMLGHDNPTYRVNTEFLHGTSGPLVWYHAKSSDALNALIREGFHRVFWQQHDTYSTICRVPFVWMNYGAPRISQGIAMLEKGRDIPPICAGVCSDWIGDYAP